MKNDDYRWMKRKRPFVSMFEEGHKFWNERWEVSEISAGEELIGEVVWIEPDVSFDRMWNEGFEIKETLVTTIMNVEPDGEYHNRWLVTFGGWSMPYRFAGFRDIMIYRGESKFEEPYRRGVGFKKYNHEFEEGELAAEYWHSSAMIQIAARLKNRDVMKREMGIREVFERFDNSAEHWEED